MHFKHYFHREWKKQISNSKIGVLIYNRTYRVLHNKVGANLRREKTKFLAKNNSVHGRLGEFLPPGSKWKQFSSFSLRSRPCWGWSGWKSKSRISFSFSFSFRIKCQFKCQMRSPHVHRIVWIKYAPKGFGKRFLVGLGLGLHISSPF